MSTRSWFLRSGLALAVAAALTVTTMPADACDPDHATGEGGHDVTTRAADSGTSSVKGVQHVGSVPDAQGAISVNFLQYGQRDVMLVSGQFGLRAYDVTADPARPRLVGRLSMPGMWETEDTEVDPIRKLVFLARDPRAFGGNTQTGESGVYVVDASNPERLEVLSYVKVPAGHTTSCVNNCRYLWTGGPAKAANMPADWGGRPVWVTDIRDPRNPKVFPEPIDTGRNDGKTDYVHDVQVDDAGIAWVSGRGGVRGYWTEGVHRDPVSNTMRRATPIEPVPYAGGGIDEVAAPSKFMHNSYRPVGRRAADGGQPAGHRGRGDILYVTEESFLSGCAGDGVLVISSLAGSYDGQGWRSRPDKPFRLRTLGTWSVAGQEGSDPNSGDCSAHYFDVRGNVLVQSFYAQGTRFLDVSDPTNPTQIAYFRPRDAASWQPMWHRGLAYVADNKRGIDILSLSR
ncbi:LVIVD repeat-containing protein [Longimycelium tulufanense]|uniref:LVIVD repeat-containing protein n=1 Tax=Longimycelium tulufanense TaxID=907463 RepID=UPI00166BF473